MHRSMIARKITPPLIKHLAPRGTRAVVLLAGGLLLSAAAFPSAAAARGFVSFHFGVPLVVGPPVYYAPPPVYYVPPPVYYIAPPAPPQTCHEYHATVAIDGKPRPVVGTACLQPDGTWRISQ